MQQRLGADLDRLTPAGATYSTSATLAHLAARDGHAEALRALAHLGADPGAGNAYRTTPAHVASEHGQVCRTSF